MRLRQRRVTETGDGLASDSPVGSAAYEPRRIARGVVTIPGLVKMLETTKPTATKSIELLEKLGIVQETTGRKRDRTYQYRTALTNTRGISNGLGRAPSSSGRAAAL
jgi:hypothetical protein